MLFKNRSFQTIYLQRLQLIMLQEESQKLKKTQEKYYTIMYNSARPFLNNKKWLTMLKTKY